MAAVLRQVEKITATLSATQQDVTLSTTLLDTSKAFLVFGIRSSSNEPSVVQVCGQILNSTTVRFDKASATSVEMVGYVVEFSSGVTVESGTWTNGTDEYDADITLSSITDISQAFHLTSLQIAGSTFGNDDAWSTYLWNDGGTLKLHLHCEQMTLTAGQYTINFQVIQLDGCSVQRGNTSMDSSTTSITDSLSPSVDLSKSCLLFNFALASTPAPDIGAMLLSGRINGADQISISRDHTGAVAIEDIRWECIEFTTMTCQEVLASYSAAQGQDDATIAELSSLSAAIAFASYNQRGGQGAYASDDIVGESWFTADLTSLTNLRTIRASTNETADAVFYVIDFGAGVTRTVNDAGAGADALAQVAVGLSLADTGAGADGFAGQAALALVDAGAGVDGLVSPIVTVHISDAGAAADALGFIGALVRALDAGTGADDLGVGVKIVIGDTGSGADAAGSSILVQIADAGTGADLVAQIGAILSIVDAGSGLDGLAGIGVMKTIGDAGVASDAIGGISVRLALADTVEATDLIARLTAAVAVDDAGAGLDIAALAQRLSIIADTGSGTDGLAGVSVSVVLADAGAAADLIARVLAAVSVADAGAGADIATAVLFVAKGRVRVTFSAKVPAIGVSAKVPSVQVSGKTPKITIQ